MRVTPGFLDELLRFFSIVRVSVRDRLSDAIKFHFSHALFGVSAGAAGGDPSLDLIGSSRWLN